MRVHLPILYFENKKISDGKQVSHRMVCRQAVLSSVMLLVKYC